MGHPSLAGTPVASRRQAHAQLIFCLGCCCGRTDRGRPEVPVERLKERWKAGRLNRVVQLTISGCVGPCDVAHVAVVVTPRGTTWLGGLAGDGPYDALVSWAEACRDAGRALPLPDPLAAHRFEWFVAEPDPSLPTPCSSALQEEETA
jgi:cobaltochelatase CobN